LAAPELRHHETPSNAYGRTTAAAGYGAAGVSVKIRRKARGEWLALIPNAHEGYVNWEKAETIRKMVSSNVPTSRHHGAPKHGDALLAGLLRCRCCGRKLTLRYSGAKHHIPRYSCSRGWMDNGESRCIAFGGLWVDDAIEDAIFTMVSPGAIAAPVAAETDASQQRDQVREALMRDLQAARYAANRAFRQYDAAGGRRLRAGCVGDVLHRARGGSGCWRVVRTDVCGRIETATRPGHPSW
jgi:hypothetical protein